MRSIARLPATRAEHRPARLPRMQNAPPFPDGAMCNFRGLRNEALCDYRKIEPVLALINPEVAFCGHCLRQRDGIAHLPRQTPALDISIDAKGMETETIG